MLALDGIGPFLENFKNLEPLKIEVADPSNVRSRKAFFLKNGN